jgi:hypothetical protein
MLKLTTQFGLHELLLKFILQMRYSFESVNFAIYKYIDVRWSWGDLLPHIAKAIAIELIVFIVPTSPHGKQH